MARKKTKIIKRLELHEVEGCSEARIEHYLSLGYRPYLDDKSRVKWLTPAQFSMRGMKSVRVPLIRRIFPPKKDHGKSRRRKRRHPIIRFLRANWLFIFLIIAVLVFVAILYFKPYLLF